MKDRQIGQALIHREPARAWTVASLMAEVAMSRSAVAARFTALVGEPAISRAFKRTVGAWPGEVRRNAALAWWGRSTSIARPESERDA